MPEDLYESATATDARAGDTTSGSTRGETMQKVDRRAKPRGRGRQREKEKEGKRSRAGADPTTRGERSSSAWRELELDLVLLVLARPFVHPRPCRARAAPVGRTTVREGRYVSGPVAGRETVRWRRFRTGDTVDKRSTRTTRRSHVPSTGLQQQRK